MLTAEQNRQRPLRGRRRQHVAAQVEWLEPRIAELEDDIEHLRQAHEPWRAHRTLLTRVPGRGKVMAKPLMAALPELGKGSDPRISPWVGLAPLNRDRGKDRGARTIWGGRAHVRAALYRGALVAVQHEPVWKAF